MWQSMMGMSSTVAAFDGVPAAAIAADPTRNFLRLHFIVALFHSADMRGEWNYSRPEGDVPCPTMPALAIHGRLSDNERAPQQGRAERGGTLAALSPPVHLQI